MMKLQRQPPITLAPCIYQALIKSTRWTLSAGPDFLNIYLRIQSSINVVSGIYHPLSVQNLLIMNHRKYLQRVKRYIHLSFCENNGKLLRGHFANKNTSNSISKTLRRFDQ